MTNIKILYQKSVIVDIKKTKFVFCDIKNNKILFIFCYLISKPNIKNKILLFLISKKQNFDIKFCFDLENNKILKQKFDTKNNKNNTTMPPLPGHIHGHTRLTTESHGPFPTCRDDKDSTQNPGKRD